MHALLLLSLLFSPIQDDYGLVQKLNDRDPETREFAAGLLGKAGSRVAIEPLIRQLEQESVERVRSALREALQRITSQDFGTDAAKWRTWWRTEGERKFSPGLHSRAEVEEILRPQLDKYRTEFGWFTIVTIIVGILFVLMMLYFTGHVSSKLREWKETAKQTEHYLKEGQEITKRTDKILEELETKKVDIVSFIGKLREENQAELERFIDLLEQNAEHHVREEIMAQRQKAEKELEQTFGERKAAIEHEVRRAVHEQQQKFLKEVESHSRYLEASFYKSHGKLDDALRLFRSVVADRPDHLVAWTEMGVVLRDLGRLEEAHEIFRKALEIKPGDSRVLYQLAATFARQKRREEMLDTLGRAVKNDGEFKDEALNDPAFREYWKDPAFRDLAEA